MNLITLILISYKPVIGQFEVLFFINITIWTISQLAVCEFLVALLFPGQYFKFCLYEIFLYIYGFNGIAQHGVEINYHSRSIAQQTYRRAKTILHNCLSSLHKTLYITFRIHKICTKFR